MKEELYIKDIKDNEEIDKQAIKCKCMECGEIFDYYMPPRCPKCDAAYVIIY